MPARIGVLFVAVTLLLGCGPPTLDASTNEKWERSVQEIRMHLPEEKRAKFDFSLDKLVFAGLEGTEGAKASSSSSELFSKTLSRIVGVNDMRNRVRASLHGKTGEQIISEARRGTEAKAERAKYIESGAKDKPVREEGEPSTLQKRSEREREQTRKRGGAR